MTFSSCGTQVFVYALVHVMCLCVYVNMVCQQCMLYDDMYSHDIVFNFQNIKNMHKGYVYQNFNFSCIKNDL